MRQAQREDTTAAPRRNWFTTNGEFTAQDPSGFRMIRRGYHVIAVPPGPDPVPGSLMNVRGKGVNASWASGDNTLPPWQPTMAHGDLPPSCALAALRKS